MELQPVSKEIYSKKYQLRNCNDDLVDLDISDTNKRIAKALAEVEPNEDDHASQYEEYLWCLENGAIPAGRIISNAGAGVHKPSASLINCTVSDTIEDSIEGIFYGGVADAAVTLAAGCGIGYEFSTVRPKGALVKGAGAKTTGPLPFMDVYDKMCFTIAAAGGRRGAQMATFDINHPDVMELITAKREDNRFRQFNISLLITSEFMQAVKDKVDWTFSFPVSASRFDPDVDYIWRQFPITEGYVVNSSGHVACEKYNTVNAADIYDLIINSTYNYAEPGFLLIDEINRQNNLYWEEEIRATNPCQPETATVLTPEGIRTFKDISVGSVIWSGTKWVSVLDKWCSGKSEVFSYRTEAGVFLGTSNHKVLVAGEKTPVVDTKFIDSVKGPVRSSVNSSLHKSFFDGSQADLENDPEVIEKFRFTKSNELRSFLRGLFLRNKRGGCGTTLGLEITIGSLNHTMMLQEMLSSLGVSSRYRVFTRNGERSSICYLIIDKDIVAFKIAVGVLIKDRDTIFTDPAKKVPVVDVTSHGVHKVYDITVDDEDHVYWTGGCLVSNCGR